MTECEDVIRLLATTWLIIVCLQFKKHLTKMKNALPENGGTDQWKLGGGGWGCCAVLFCPHASGLFQEIVGNCGPSDRKDATDDPLKRF